jgi:hypothetical protein
METGEKIFLWLGGVALTMYAIFSFTTLGDRITELEKQQLADPIEMCVEDERIAELVKSVDTLKFTIVELENTIEENERVGNTNFNKFVDHYNICHPKKQFKND